MTNALVAEALAYGDMGLALHPRAGGVASASPTAAALTSRRPTSS